MQIKFLKLAAAAPKNERTDNFSITMNGINDIEKTINEDAANEKVISAESSQVESEKSVANEFSSDVSRGIAGGVLEDLEVAGENGAAEKNGVAGENDIFMRERALIGEKAFEKLKNSSVAVFGLGGVGSYACEALARAGIGKILVCDNDVISPHNANRQLYALKSTVGVKKTELAAERIKQINPNAEVIAVSAPYQADTERLFDLENYDYIADCIDTVTSKILLAERAFRGGIKIISCMGTGNKLQTSFKVADISKTSVCPLAKVMRRELKARGVTKLKVVYSEEQPKKSPLKSEGARRCPPASVSYVPPVAGFVLAGEIIRELIGEN